MICILNIFSFVKQLEKARQEARSKDESLRKLEESLQNLESKTKGKDQIYKNQQEKIKELEGTLELKTALHSQLEKQVSQLSDRLRGKEEICCSLQQKVALYLNNYYLCASLLLMLLELYLLKVKELEIELRERHKSDSEYASLQQKVAGLMFRIFFFPFLYVSFKPEALLYCFSFFKMCASYCLWICSKKMKA